MQSILVQGQTGATRVEPWGLSAKSISKGLFYTEHEPRVLFMLGKHSTTEPQLL